MKQITQEIQKSHGIWVSKEHESNTHECSQNLLTRIINLSVGESFIQCLKEWNHITGHFTSTTYKLTKDINKRESKGASIIGSDFCLCGMIIKECYYVYNEHTKQTAQIGNKCIERIDPLLVQRYEKSLIKKGTCFCCHKHFDHIDKHYKSKSHLLKLKKIYEKLIPQLNTIVSKHVHKVREAQKTLEAKEAYDKITRECIECTNRILLTELHWKTRCIGCYFGTIKKYNTTLNQAMKSKTT